MPRKILPSQWNTQRLNIADSTLAETPELQKINDAVPATQSWMHVDDKNESCSMLAALEDGVLPPTPDRTKAYFRLQSVRLASTGTLIGFLAAYHGFPEIDVFWINAFTLAPEFQRHGYGTELLGGLCDIAKQLGSYTCMRSYVALNNVPSLRMCVKVGFNRILEVAVESKNSGLDETHLLVEKSLV